MVPKSGSMWQRKQDYHRARQQLNSPFSLLEEVVRDSVRLGSVASFTHPISRRPPTPGHLLPSFPLTLVEAGSRLLGSPWS
jgi:hypothetical protein